MLVHIEGNVGSGKSTLLHHLKQGLTGCTTVPEPVAGWAALSRQRHAHERVTVHVVRRQTRFQEFSWHDVLDCVASEAQRLVDAHDFVAELCVRQEGVRAGQEM